MNLFKISLFIICFLMCIGIVNAQTFFITPNCAQINGVQFTASEQGTYRFYLTSGAYGLWDSGNGHWRTLVNIYKNRAVVWCSYPPTGERAPCNPDFSIGATPLSQTYALAEAAGIGDFVNVDLNAGDYVMMIAPDGETGYCGNGCQAGVNVDVTVTSLGLTRLVPTERSKN